MSEPIKLVAFCGSLRKASFNRMALHAFIERAPAGATVETIEIGDWPLYDADIQANGFPDKVQAAQKAMLAADGIVLVSPEYNYGISGVLKNAIDWLSRMTPQPFAAKPVALFGASGGVPSEAERGRVLAVDSASLNTATVASPSSVADRRIRQAISPRLATSTESKCPAVMVR